MLKTAFGNGVNAYFNPLKGSTMYSLIHVLDYDLLSLILMYCLEIYRDIEIMSLAMIVYDPFIAGTPLLPFI